MTYCSFKILGLAVIAAAMAASLPGFDAALAAPAVQDKTQSCSASALTQVLARADAALLASRHADAMRDYTLAANCGRAAAQSRLGYMLLTGQGTPPDEKVAADWFGKAAEQGDSYAQLNFANLLLDGRGITKDEAAAYIWYLAAAKQESANAQFSTGVVLQMGRGVTADQVQAADWFYKAALAISAVPSSSARLSSDNSPSVSLRT